MPINAYTGLMGSGKTYEVVGFVILPALLRGRRVVTNIEGLDYQKICAYLHAKHPDADLGELLLVTNEQISADGFFPCRDGDEDAIVKGGDMVCIDEAWRFFGTSTKIPTTTQVFLREHRHYTDPQTQVSCDLALMLQSIGDLHRTVKSVVELSFRTHKLKTVGLNKRYRLDMFEGTNQKISTRANTWQKAYEPAIFGLYNSYAAGSGKELAIDDRQNILKDPRNWAMAAGVLCLLGTGVWGINYLFSKYNGKNVPPASEAAATNGPAGQARPPAAPTVPTAPPKLVQSQDWRLAGRIVTARGERAVLTGQAGRVRVEDPALFLGHGWDRRAMVEGEQISAWSGPATGGGTASTDNKAFTVGK
jgi:zona occludens toxin